MKRPLEKQIKEDKRIVKGNQVIWRQTLILLQEKEVSFLSLEKNLKKATMRLALGK